MKKILPFLLLTLLFAPPIHAATIMGISAIPPRLEVKVDPGKTITKEIKVRNESAQTQTISTKIKDFIVVDDSGTPIQIDNLDPSTNRWAASSWIQVSASSLKLKPGETKSLFVTVIAPPDALPGGHYAMILHSPQTGTILSQTGSVIETNVGTLVYITIPGNIKETAVVKEFSAPTFSEYGPINFKTIITNLSDIHITPVGRISITDVFGLQTNLPQIDTVNLFPYTSHEYQQSLDKKLLFGRFKATFLASYGTTGQLLNATVFFWVIPWRLLLALLGIIITLTLITHLRRHPSQPNSDNPQLLKLETELEALKKKYRDQK